MRRKPEIRYTDMAIYVDNHIREKDRDVEKIIEAKLMLFRGKELIKCPCAAQDEERYCGSPKCTQEVKEKGVCHCHLFEVKNE